MAKKKQKLVKSKTPFKGHKELHSSSVKNGRSNVSVPSNKKAMKKATGNCLENNDESESSEFEEVPASRSNAKKVDFNVLAHINLGVGFFLSKKNHKSYNII